jgi:hypothetical protein
LEEFYINFAIGERLVEFQFASAAGDCELADLSVAQKGAASVRPYGGLIWRSFT